MNRLKKGDFVPFGYFFRKSQDFITDFFNFTINFSSFSINFRLFSTNSHLFTRFYCQLSGFIFNFQPFRSTFTVYFQLPTFMTNPTSITNSHTPHSHHHPPSNQKTTPPGHPLQRVRPNRVILFFISVRSQYIDSVHGLPSGFPHRSGSRGQHGSPCARRMAWPRGKRDD